MLKTLLISIPFGLVWTAITNRLNLESFVVGYLLSVGMLLLLRPGGTIMWRRLPDQILATVTFLLWLYRDILLSGIDLARRVLSRDMRLKPGIIAISTQDPEKSELIAALSSDVITLTPGELVVDLDEKSIMYVHCLDVEKSAEAAEQVQAHRLRLLNRILGRSS